MTRPPETSWSLSPTGHCRRRGSPATRTHPSTLPGRSRRASLAKKLAGDGLVCVTAGDLGGQAFSAGLVDEIAMDVAPVVLGEGVRFFGSHAGTVLLGGNQTREMLVGDVYLTNVEETVLPEPWVKWSYQPVRAEDVPAAIMRAYAVALQPPARPRISFGPAGRLGQACAGQRRREDCQHSSRPRSRAGKEIRRQDQRCSQSSTGLRTRPRKGGRVGRWRKVRRETSGPRIVLTIY